MVDLGDEENSNSLPLEEKDAMILGEYNRSLHMKRSIARLKMNGIT